MAIPLTIQTYKEMGNWDSTALYTITPGANQSFIPVVAYNGKRFSMSNGQAAIGGVPGVDTAWVSFSGAETSLTPAAVATTANITLSGEQTIDGVLTSASRVLVKNQTLSQNNGVYVSGAGAWTRSTDANTWNELVGASIQITAGSTQANFIYTSDTEPGGTLGTTPITFTQTGVGGNGTVTSVSVVSANGLAGTVATATTTPAITLTTSVTGLLQGNGTAISAVTPVNNAVLVSNGSGLPTYTTLLPATVTSGSTQVANPVTSNTTTLDVALAAIHSGGSGSGTVTSASVVTANGFAGTVATATTTPAITITTSITGILQGNGTAISAATTTGTGDVVLATSPTLITPNIGTATGNITGTAGLATSIAGGIANNVPYQTGAGVTAFIAPVNNAVLVTNGSGVPAWQEDIPAANFQLNATTAVVDGSGASLSITINAGNNTIMTGGMCYLYLSITYPVTASPAVASLTGIPLDALFPTPLSLVSTTSVTATGGSSYIALLTGAAFTFVTPLDPNIPLLNSELSGKTIIISGTYRFQ